MELLTYVEYESISLNPIDASAFQKMNQLATEIINTNTRNFYIGNNFELDHPWRKEAVKRAISYQIDFLDKTGITTLEEMQSSPQSFSAGRTSITNSNSQSRETKRETLLSADARSVLSGTGLLYRGVGYL